MPRINSNTRRHVTENRRHFARWTDPLLAAKWTRRERARALKAERAGEVKPDPLAWVNVPARIFLGEGAEWTDAHGNAWKIYAEPEADDCGMGDFDPKFSNRAPKLHSRRNTGGGPYPWVFNRAEQFGAAVMRHSFQAIEVPSGLDDDRPQALRDAAHRYAEARRRSSYYGRRPEDEIKALRERLEDECHAWRLKRALDRYSYRDGTPRHEAWEADKARALLAAEGMERRIRDDAPWGWWARVTVTDSEGNQIAEDSIGGLAADDDAGWRECLIDTAIAHAAYEVAHHVPTRSIDLTAEDAQVLRDAIGDSIQAYEDAEAADPGEYEGAKAALRALESRIAALFQKAEG